MTKTVQWATALLIILLASQNATAQTLSVISGTVTDSKTGEAIANANVQIVGKTVGDVADSTGAFEIHGLTPGRYKLKASRIGYKPEIQDYSLRGVNRGIVNFKLEPTLLPLENVEIEAERLWENYLTEASIVGVRKMKSREIINIPGALDDPSRAVQIFSGVSGGGDYSGYLAVRGGSPDQNQVIIDGVVIPNPYRFRLAFGGGLSIINPSTTDDLYLHLGGFSAQYGNSLSSILEVESRIGRRDRIHGQGSLNFTDAGAVVEGPLPRDKGSYLFSFRRSYYDLLVNQLSKNDAAFPFFREFSSRWLFELSKRDRLLLSYSRFREGAELINEFSDDLGIEEQGESDVASLTWRRLNGEKWRFSTTLSFYSDKTSYRAFAPDTSTIIDGSYAVLQEYESLNAKEKNIAFRHDARLKTGAESWLNFGAAVTSVPARIHFDGTDIGFLYARTEAPGDIDFDRTHRIYAGYLESVTKATDKLHFRIGARYDYSTLVDEGELSPRITAWYALSERTKLEGSWGLFYQVPNPMTVYSRNIAVDLSQNPDVLSAEKATHQIIGVEQRFTQRYSAKAQFYYKAIDRLLLPENETNFTPKNDGRGLAYGLELVLQNKPMPENRVSGVLSYAFGNARFRSESDDSDQSYPFKYVRRHALMLLGNLRLVGNWNLSVLGQMANGQPYTDVIGIRLQTGFSRSIWQFQSGPRFGAQFPDFRKLDARLSYRHGGRQHMAFEFYLDVINLTNERNIAEITWELRPLPDGKREAIRRQIYMLPRLPSIGLSVRF